MTDILLAEMRGQILVLTINRPERMNSLGGTLLQELNAAFDEGRRSPRSPL